MKAIRKSPLHNVVAKLQPEWGMRNDMQTALRFDHSDSQHLAALAVVDVSCLWRCGLKGPRSVEWLEAQGILVPAVNSWIALAQGGVIARLGVTEFLLEDGLTGTAVCLIQSLLTDRPQGVYPVLREDAALLVSGSALQALLRQTCSFNFMELDVATRPVVLTTMVGVAVTILPQASADGMHYRIWCDGTYGEYLWRTLLDIASELDGGAAGFDDLILEGKLQ